MTSAAFSSDAQSTLEQAISEAHTGDINISEYFELERCAEFIKSNKFERVSLQFPDELLPYVLNVCTALQNAVNERVYVLGDTSYGNCCVDEVTAAHINADCVIHFGRACLSRVHTIPTLYVFGRDEIDINDCACKFRELFADTSDRVLIFFDTPLSHACDALVELLLDYKNIVSARIDDNLVEQHPTSGTALSPCSSGTALSPCSREPNKGAPSASCCLDNNGCADTSNGCLDTSNDCLVTKDNCLDNTGCCADQIIEDDTESVPVASNLSISQFGHVYSLSTDLSEYKCFYVGREGLALTNLMLSYNKNSFFTYEPTSCIGRMETLNVSRALMKRYYYVERAKDANIMGILIGTLAVAGFNDIIERLKKLIHNAGKKSYTILVGKVNVCKLANFAEIDVFVLVACPQNSLLDSREFLKPIITPYECELACLRARQWTGDYVTDFSELLPGAARHVDMKDDEDAVDSDDDDFSFITGKMRNKRRIEEESDQVAIRSESSVVRASDASEYLTQRSWTGLQIIDEKPIERVMEGKSGIASAYQGEGER